MKFSDCTLDLSARQLERSGKVVPLEPKVYELLELLIKRRPAVISSNELDELLWPNVYVERSGLPRLVSKLRSALGDTSHESRIIRTAYKVGYAFCAELGEASGSAASARMQLMWGTRSMPLADGEHFAGRDDSCALVINASTVSRRHARITVVAGNATVEDLASTNGTSVNGRRISQPTYLRPGDELSLGSELLRVGVHSSSVLTVKVEPEETSTGRTSRKVR